MSSAEPRIPPSEPVNPLASLVGYELRRASAAVMARLQVALAPTGLSVVEASVLRVVEENPGITQSEIGRLLGIRRANMAPIAAKLADLGLTKPEPDGRATRLRVSKKGGKVSTTVRLAMEENEARFLDGFGARDRARLVAWLRAVGSRA